MDLNQEYAAHQQALIRAERATTDDERRTHNAHASIIASKIGAFQQKLGAAAACAWSKAQVSIARFN